MQGERHAALRACQRRPARGTLEIGRKAATVEEDERLSTGRKIFLERGAELVREEARTRTAVHASAEIDQLDAREGVGRRTLGQLEEQVPPGARRVIALGRRGGGGEHHDGSRQARPHHGQVARIVAQTPPWRPGGAGVPPATAGSAGAIKTSGFPLPVTPRRTKEAEVPWPSAMPSASTALRWADVRRGRSALRSSWGTAGHGSRTIVSARPAATSPRSAVA